MEDDEDEDLSGEELMIGGPLVDLNHEDKASFIRKQVRVLRHSRIESILGYTMD